MNKMLKKLNKIIKKPQTQLITALLLSSVLSTAFVIMRMAYSQRITYKFMVWNLFLAWIPLILATIVNKIKSKNLYTKSIKYLLTFLWLLFLPNAFYIITDLFHLNNLLHSRIPLWYDLILIISFAWNGMILGYYSLYLMHQNIKNKINPIITWLIIAVIIFLSSFGIYVGRYQRWNSWDVFAKPWDLVIDIGIRVMNPFKYPGLLGLTTAFSAFFIVGYAIFRIITNLNKSNKE